MSSYAPPAGPPPPSVPPGWKAVFNDQYKEWFYVNLTTKESTWTKPTEPAPGYGGGDDHAPSGAPPAYSAAGPEKPTAAGDIKTGLHDTKAPTGDSDEALARRLQEEENARASSSTAPGQAAQVGQAADYYNSSSSGSGPSAPGVGGQTDQQRFGGRPEEGYNPSTSRDKGKGGLFGKLMGKMQSQGGSYPPRQDHGGYQNQNYGQYPPQQQYYGNSPMAPGYGPPQQGYGYPPQQQGYYGGGYAQQQPARKHGMGAGGAAALGVGGGLLGGMLIGEALGDAGDHGDYGGGDGGDYGGDGGGDFGGDGGGDFGGGDFGGGGF